MKKEKTIDDLTQSLNDEMTIDDKLKLQVIGNLLDDKHKKTNSRLSKYQVNPLTKLYLFANVFQSDIAKQIADNILLLQVSLNGYGRKELVQILSTQESIPPQDQKIINKDIFR